MGLSSAVTTWTDVFALDPSLSRSAATQAWLTQVRFRAVADWTLRDFV
jgi:hypothetical protein